MRVLVLHSRYLSGSVSGENRVVEDEVRLLREGGHEVAVFAPEPQADKVRGRAVLGVGSVWSSSAVRSVRRLIARHRPDIVHVHNLFPMLSPAVIRAASDEAPVVMTLHNYRLHCLPGTLFRDGRACEDCVGHVPWRGVVHRCFRGSGPASAALASSLTLHRAIASFDRVRLFLAVSGFVRDLHVRAGLDPSRIRVRQNFSWPLPLRVGPGEYFLYLGRLSAEKGVRDLLEAWRDVDAPLLIAGDGPLERELGAWASAHVRFLGVLDPVQSAASLARARALVVPSVCFEAGPRVAIEATACGVPVIASRSGSLPEIVRDDVSGIVVPPGDWPSLAAAAQRLLDDAESERLGRGAARDWQERFTPERGLESLLSCFREAA